MKLKTIWAILFGRFESVKYTDENRVEFNAEIDDDNTFYFFNEYYVKFKKNRLSTHGTGTRNFSKDVKRLSDFYAILSVGGEKIAIQLQKDRHTILFPRIQFLLGMMKQSPTLRASSTIVHMKSILNRNETLMKDCLSEIKMLKADMKLYAEAGLEQQYKQTHDILLANKAMLEQQVQTIEMAIMKAEVTHKEIQLQTKFLDTLKAREERIRSLASKTLMLHSETASTMQLIENKVGDIDTLKRLCNGVISLNDHAQIGIIHDTLKETERDFSNVFSKRNFDLLVS